MKLGLFLITGFAVFQCLVSLQIKEKCACFNVELFKNM